MSVRFLAWYFAIKPGVEQYVALAKREPFVTQGPDPVYEPGELWYEFGDTPEEALGRLVASLPTGVKENA